MIGAFRSTTGLSFGGGSCVSFIFKLRAVMLHSSSRDGVIQRLQEVAVEPIWQTSTDSNL